MRTDPELMIALRRIVEKPEAAPPAIVGKYPTGPNCYDQQPRRRQDRPMVDPVLTVPCGRRRASVLTEQGRERCREAGRKGGAQRSATLAKRRAEGNEQ